MSESLNDRLAPGGLHEVPVYSLDANGNVTGLEGPDGSNTLTFDTNGNLIAAVSLRTDTLDNLMDVSGGDGEIAVANDIPALVKYNNSGAGSAYGGLGPIYMSAFYGDSIALTAGAPSVLPLAKYSGDTDARIDTDNDYVTVPTLVKTGQKYLIEMDVSVNFSAAAGAYRRVSLWLDTGGGFGGAPVEFVDTPVVSASYPVIVHYTYRYLLTATAVTTFKVQWKALSDTNCNAYIMVGAIRTIAVA